jgi:hypothetical protein
MAQAEEPASILRHLSGARECAQRKNRLVAQVFTRVRVRHGFGVIGTGRATGHFDADHSMGIVMALYNR